jgi:hypothetical protein
MNEMYDQRLNGVGLSSYEGQSAITLQQWHSERAKLPGLLMMAAFAGAIILPQIGLVLYALASSEFRAALAEHPFAAVELAIAFAFWVMLVCWPLRKIVLALISDRIVDIRHGEVTVVDKSVFSSTSWRLPLGTYEGIAINIRTSLSGNSQEAMLVHPEPSRSIILATAEHFGMPEIRELCRILGLPLLSPDRPGTAVQNSHTPEGDATLAPATV